MTLGKGIALPGKGARAVMDPGKDHGSDAISRFGALLVRARLLDVLLRSGLVGREEVESLVLCDPRGKFDHLFAQALDGLGIHVRLRDELGKFDCWGMIRLATLCERGAS